MQLSSLLAEKKLARSFEHVTVFWNRFLNTSWRGGSYLGVFGAAGFGDGGSGCNSCELLYKFQLHEGFSSVTTGGNSTAEPCFHWASAVIWELWEFKVVTSVLWYGEGSYCPCSCSGACATPLVCLCYSSTLPLLSTKPTISTFIIAPDSY